MSDIIRGTGAIPSDPSPLDFAPIRFGAASFPPTFQTSPRIAPNDQGSTNHCVGKSRQTNQAILDYPEFGKFISYDGDELYYASVAQEGRPRYEGGTQLRTALDISRKRGIKVFGKDEYAKIDMYTRLYAEDDIKAAVVNFGFAWVATKWYRSWLNVKTRRLPAASVQFGYHAYNIVGWNTYGWIIENQYGRDWADDGFAEMSYGTFNNIMVEAWQIIDLNETLIAQGDTVIIGDTDQVRTSNKFVTLPPSTQIWKNAALTEPLTTTSKDTAVDVEYYGSTGNSWAVEVSTGRATTDGVLHPVIAFIEKVGTVKDKTPEVLPPAVDPNPELQRQLAEAVAARDAALAAVAAEKTGRAEAELKLGKVKEIVE